MKKPGIWIGVKFSQWPVGHPWGDSILVAIRPPLNHERMWRCLKTLLPPSLSFFCRRRSTAPRSQTGQRSPPGSTIWCGTGSIVLLCAARGGNFAVHKFSQHSFIQIKIWDFFAGKRLRSQRIHKKRVFLHWGKDICHKRFQAKGLSTFLFPRVVANLLHGNAKICTQKKHRIEVAEYWL